MPFARSSEIYGETDPAEYLYKVIRGTVRTYKLLVDGRRQIGAFHVPGDVFGFESGAEHTFSAEAITDCRLAVPLRLWGVDTSVEALALQHSDLDFVPASEFPCWHVCDSLLLGARGVQGRPLKGKRQSVTVITGPSSRMLQLGGVHNSISAVRKMEQPSWCAIPGASCSSSPKHIAKLVS
jgi:hypothetical protein